MTGEHKNRVFSLTRHIAKPIIQTIRGAADAPNWNRTQDFAGVVNRSAGGDGIVRGKEISIVCFRKVNRNEEISMKKTLLTCLAIVAVFAVASSASAVTCTIDQRPAATLLVPYFQVSYDADGNLVTTGAGARDTIVTIANASSAPMIAHVNVYNRFSELVLDFNVALTGFDVQAMRMSAIISGILPNTPLDEDHEPLGDVCQRAQPANPRVYPDAGGFIRVFPTDPATPTDNVLATTQYDQ